MKHFSLMFAKWIILICLDLGGEENARFFDNLSSPKPNKIFRFFENWYGYMLSKNPGYYWLFWKLLDSDLQSRWIKNKLYYPVPWRQ
jgi:hypothetical protein